MIFLRPATKVMTNYQRLYLTFDLITNRYLVYYMYEEYINLLKWIVSLPMKVILTNKLINNF